MKASTASLRRDDHGASQLPRDRVLGRLAIARGLFASTGVPVATIIQDRWPDLSGGQRDLINSMSPKAAGEVPSVDTTNPSTASGQTFAGVARESLFSRLPVLADVKLKTLIGAFAAGPPTGVIHQPGRPIPLMTLDFAQADLAPVKAAALLVVSAELLRQPECERSLTDLLVQAAAQAIDAEIIGRALNGASASASGANTPATLLAELGIAIAALITAGADPRRIILAANPATLLGLATCCSPLTGEPSFPTVGVTGGSLAGLPLVSTLAAAPGAIVAIAGDACLRAPGTIDVDASRSAKLEYASDPTGKAEPGQTPVAQSKTPVDLYQTDSVALRVFANFGFDTVRDVAARFIDGIDLSGETA